MNVLDFLRSSLAWEHRDVIIDGVLVSLSIFAPVTIGSVILGVSLSVMRYTRLPFLGDFADYYVHFFRNVPAIVKMFFLFFAINLDGYESAVIGLTIHHAAYMAEVVQAGMNSTSSDLEQAALASGFTRGKALRYVVLPVSLRLVIPPITTQIVQILKNTAVAMAITVPELTLVLSTLNDETFRSVEIALIGAVIYGSLAALIIGVMAAIECRYRLNV
jgi:His/Glu/Gln/Arg/opine family amino acid ABC transporter permease subunit